MKKKILISVLGFLCLNFGAFAQQTKLPGLQIGDPVPPITLKNVLNSDIPYIDLSALTHQVVILDFWATWCSSCIKEFPREQQLEDELHGKLKIVLVNSVKSTHEKKDKVISFLNKHKTNLSLTTAYEDTLLNLLFPHFTLPHYVWLYQGKVAAITAADEVSKDNIEALLKNGIVKSHEKQDITFKRGQPLFKFNPDDSLPAPLFQSVLTGYLDGYNSRSGFEQLRKSNSFSLYVVNMPRLALFQFAFPAFRGFDKNRIIYNVSNAADYSTDSTSYNWKRRNLFTYEQISPVGNIDTMRSSMQHDLLQYFTVRLSVKPYKTKVLVFTQTGKIPISDPSEESCTNIQERYVQKRFFNNLSLITLITELNNIYHIPVIDETGYSGNLTLKLPDDLKDIKALINILSKQGIKISQETHVLSFLFISDPSNPLQTNHPQS